MAEKEIIKEDEIDLIEIVKTLWSGRNLVIKIATIFFILGLLIAYTSKIEYQASCKLMPESQKEATQGLGGLGGLAGLAGINLNLGSSGALTPELYPEIVRSVPFLQKLIDTPIYFERIDTTVSSFTYFKEIDRPSLFGTVKSYTIGLPGKIRNSLWPPKESELKDFGLIRFSGADRGIIDRYSKRLSVSVDSQTGIILIETQMPDAVASAKVASLLVQELTKSISDYKLEKVKINLQFIAERFAEAKDEYEKRQNLLARFTDRNRNISNSLIQTEYERLQNEMDITFEVYKGLASQLTQAKIKVKEETPVFTILEPVTIPVSKLKPKRKLIIMASIFLGAFVGFVWVLFEDKFLKKQ